MSANQPPPEADEPLDLDEISRRLQVLERSVPGPGARYDAVRARLEKEAFPRLLAWLGPRGLPQDEAGRRELEAQARAVVDQVAQGVAPRPDANTCEAAARALVREVSGAGPLQELLEDPEVTEIMVNGPSRVWVERQGRIVPTDVRFRDEQHLTNLIRRVAERLDRHVDFRSPTLDGRLPDGSRVHAVLPPVAPDGPLLTVRKFRPMFDQMEDLIRVGTLRPEIAFFLGACVKARLNIAIGGPSSSGKTTTLNVLTSQVPAGERVVTIEELTELDLTRAHGHVVRLQTRQENVEGAGAVGVRQLVREALRMRADRIVVGEARGAEMIDVLQAMRCGHDGSMTTIHASSPEDLIERAVTISLFGDLPLSESSARRMVVDALDVLVIMGRFADGSRRVVQVVEPRREPDGEVHFQEVFRFDHRGYDAAGHPLGTFVAVAPSLHAERFAQAGLSLPEQTPGELQ